MSNKTKHACIIVRYHYKGKDTWNYHEDDDWDCYYNVNLNQALQRFWCKKPFHYEEDRAEYKEDFQIFEIMYFESSGEASDWKRNWWDIHE